VHCISYLLLCDKLMLKTLLLKTFGSHIVSEDEESWSSLFGWSGSRSFVRSQSSCQLQLQSSEGWPWAFKWKSHFQCGCWQQDSIPHWLLTERSQYMGLSMGLLGSLHGSWRSSEFVIQARESGTSGFLWPGFIIKHPYLCLGVINREAVLQPTL
jgi:hypothetical protein